MFTMQGGVFRSVQAPAREHQITKVGAGKRIASPVSKKFLGSPPPPSFYISGVDTRCWERGREREKRTRARARRDWSTPSLRSPPLPPLLSAIMSAPCWQKRLDRSVLHLFPLTIK